MLLQRGLIDIPQPDDQDLQSSKPSTVTASLSAEPSAISVSGALVRSKTEEVMVTEVQIEDLDARAAPTMEQIFNSDAFAHVCLME